MIRGPASCRRTGPRAIPRSSRCSRKRKASSSRADAARAPPARDRCAGIPALLRRRVRPPPSGARACHAEARPRRDSSGYTTLRAAFGAHRSAAQRARRRGECSGLVLVVLAFQLVPRGHVEIVATAAGAGRAAGGDLYMTTRSEEHTSELQSRGHLVCRLLLEKKKRTCGRHPPG